MKIMKKSEMLKKNQVAHIRAERYEHSTESIYRHVLIYVGV